MPEATYWKPTKSSGFQGDLTGVWETQRREWSASDKRFNPVWIIQMEEGKWKGFSDPNIVEVFKAQGKEMFPATTLTLQFMTDSDQEIRWELKLGRKGAVSEAEKALGRALGIDLSKCRNVQEKGDAIALAGGGKEFQVRTPSFAMTGDSVSIINQLLEGNWWTMDDVTAGVAGRNEPIGTIDPATGNERSQADIINARAAQGFIGRPYSIMVNEPGHHAFQGFTTLDEYLAQAAAREREAQANPQRPQYVEEDIPF